MLRSFRSSLAVKPKVSEVIVAGEFVCSLYSEV
jgi:hypothetical protein